MQCSWSLVWCSVVSALRRFSAPIFRPPRATTHHTVVQLFYLFACLDLLSVLTLLFSDCSHHCCSICPSSSVYMPYMSKEYHKLYIATNMVIVTIAAWIPKDVGLDTLKRRIHLNLWSTTPIVQHGLSTRIQCLDLTALGWDIWKSHVSGGWLFIDSVGIMFWPSGTWAFALEVAQELCQSKNWQSGKNLPRTKHCSAPQRKVSTGACNSSNAD